MPDPEHFREPFRQSNFKVEIVQIRFKEDKFGILSKQQVAATDIEQHRAAGIADRSVRVRDVAGLQLCS